MEELEEACRRGDQEGLIERLEALRRRGGGREKAVRGDRERMKDENGIWYEGSGLVSKWREVFESVGRELEEQEGFDEDEKVEVEKEVARWVRDGRRDEDEYIVQETDEGVRVMGWIWRFSGGRWRGQSRG